MIVNIILWLFVSIWILVWAATFLKILTLNPYESVMWQRHGKFKYGMIDVLGILALVGIIARNW